MKHETTKAESASRREVMELDDDDNDNDECSIPKSYDAYRAYHATPSKISRQARRFLKYCNFKISSPTLYASQLKPMILGYL